MRLFLLLPLPASFMLWIGATEWIYNLVTPRPELAPLPHGNSSLHFPIQLSDETTPPCRNLSFPVRVTGENPPRNLGRLDWERCAELHNIIVKAGWVLSGRKFSDLVAPTWWEVYGDDEIARDGRLDDSVVKFLQLAMLEPLDTASNDWHFFRLARSLAPPSMLFDRNNGDGDGHYVQLYQSSRAVGTFAPQGLIYDQRKHVAIYQAFRGNNWQTRHGSAQWLPLELILDGWIQMIEQQKLVPFPVTLLNTTNGAILTQEWTEPWGMVPYSFDDLLDSLSLWNSLVQSIEERMLPTSLSSDEIEYGFFNADEDDDDKSTKTVRDNDFARKFLEHARKPRFRYIAPGLEFNPMTVKQPFADEETMSEEFIRPVLLASGPANAVEDHRRMDPYTPDIILSDVPFRKQFPKIPFFPSGLYLTETEPARNLPYLVCLPLIHEAWRSKPAPRLTSMRYKNHLPANPVCF